MKKISLFLLTLFFVLSLKANEFTNIFVEQRDDGSGIVDITYDFSAATGTLYNMRLEVTFDGVDFHPIAPVGLSGDIVRVAPGTGHSIVWNGMLTHPDTYSEGAVIRMTANLAAGFMNDIDGNTYATAVIGNQEWMGENLRVTRYRGGDQILTDLNAEKWLAINEGALTQLPYEEMPGFNSNEEVREAFGALYNGWTLVDERELCPFGWRVPAREDMLQLIDYIINDYTYSNFTEETVGQALKSCRGTDTPLGGDCIVSEQPAWAYDITNYPEVYGLDSFGFAALPTSFAGVDGQVYPPAGADGFWWLAPPDEGEGWGGNSSYFYSLDFSTNAIMPFTYNPFGTEEAGFQFGYSVRCIRDVD